MSATKIEIRCADGRVLPGTWHAAAHLRATLTIAPAMGVPRGYYDKFASYLAQRGISTLTFDYRGVAEGEGSRAEDAQVNMEQWGRLDLNAALELSAQRSPDAPLFCVAHCAGGQVLGLAPASERLAGLVLVAAGAPHASMWRGVAYLKVLLVWYVLAPLTAALRLRFPMRVKVASGVARQWAVWGRSRRYLFNPVHGLDTGRYRRLRQPALALEFADDTALAPANTIDALLAEMPALQLTRRRIAPTDVGAKQIGHLGFFKEVMRDTLWRDTADWILQHAKIK